MSKKLKMVGQTIMALNTLKCSHLTPLEMKGLTTGGGRDGSNSSSSSSINSCCNDEFISVLSFRTRTANPLNGRDVNWLHLAIKV